MTIAFLGGVALGLLESSGSSSPVIGPGSLKMGIEFQGLFIPRELDAWTLRQQREINDRVTKAMKSALPMAKERIRSHISSKLNVKKNGFANVMRGEVIEKDMALPVTVFWSKAGWLGAHETGATITGKGKGVMIPINTTTRNGRLGYKAFKRTIQQLAAQGNLEFRKIKGKIIVFAETAGSGSALRKHNKRVGANRHSHKRSAEVPIAIFVPSARLPKRLDLAGLEAQLTTEVRDRIADELER